MNYLEIADAYDAQADALIAAVGKVSTPPDAALAILELREKAADNRAAHAREQDHLEHRAFEYKTRTAYLELERRNVAARELQAESLRRTAGYYAEITVAMKRLTEVK